MTKTVFYDEKHYSKEGIENILKNSEDGVKDIIDQRLAHTLDMIEGKNILDVGCAAGSLSKKWRTDGPYRLRHRLFLRNQSEFSKNLIVLTTLFLKLGIC